MPDIERKGVHVLTADIKSAKADGDTYDITLSVPTEDRDGEVVDAKAFEPLPEGRMPIDVDHGMTVLTTVGSGVPQYDGDALKLTDFRFASTALGQDVRALVDEGHISKMSVAFMDALREKDEKDGLMHVRKAELLNAAVVAIPSNREADIAFAAKAALTAFKVGARNSAKDAELIQTMHDSATSLGATCDGKTKSVDLTEDTGTTADTDPEDTAASAAVTPPAEVDVARALTELTLVEADLALE
jgi:HK97 family phage prohead protease